MPVFYNRGNKGEKLMFKANDTIEEEYKKRITFITEQIEKCEQFVRKNQQEIGQIKNKKEKLLLKDLICILERKIKYLTEELEQTQCLLQKSSG